MDRLRAELPQIARWAWAGWNNLQERGRFITTRSHAEAASHVADMGNPLRVFVRDHIVIDPKARVLCADYRRFYVEWCEENGHKPMSNTNLAVGMKTIFQSMGWPMYERVRVRSGADLHYAYIGIRLREPYEDVE